MNIEKGEIITLSNNKEYICFETLTHNEINYLYLMSNFKPIEIKFAKQTIEDGKIMVTIINDQQEKMKVFELFQEKM